MRSSASYQLAVIGSGAGGKEAAILGASNGLRVVLIEKSVLGGTSFHCGYYSVRAFRAYAEALRESAQSPAVHFQEPLCRTDLPVWAHIQQQVSARLEREFTDTLNRMGIAVRFGRGSLIDRNRVRVEGIQGEPETILADNIIIATGSRPAFDGHALGSRFVNIDQLLRLAYLPKRFLIVGGGYIGCEIASIFRSLGCAVDVIEKQNLLPDWDVFIGGQIARALHSSGVGLHLGQEADLQHPGGTSEEPSFPVEGGVRVSGDLVLVASGRKPNVEGLGLDRVKVITDPFILVDERMRTSVPNIFGVGDVNGFGLMDSVAVAQARVAVGAILGKKTQFSKRSVPRCAHTDPPVASVGWTEEEAVRAGLSVTAHIGTFKCVTEDEKSVIDPVPIMVKILVDTQSRMILGVHAIGRHAAEIVNAATFSMRSGTTVDDLSEITFVHESAAEILQELATKVRSLLEPVFI